MNYEAAWGLMADLIAELRKNGETVPADVMRDLRAAKTMIEILKVDGSHSESILRIEEYLSNVESYLMPVVQTKLEAKYMEQWTGKMLEARVDAQPCGAESPAKFPVGLPRDARWVRIQDLKETPPEKIRNLAEEEGLKYRIEENGHVLVYGEEAKVKRFVKKIMGLHES